MKKQVTNWGKLFANHISDQGLVSRNPKVILLYKKGQKHISTSKKRYSNNQ